MNLDGHLSTDLLREFRSGDVSHSEKLSVERHLIQCSECRARSPLPAALEFWSAVFHEDNAAAIGSGRWFLGKELIGSLRFRQAFRLAIPASLLLLIAGGFAYLFFGPIAASRNESEIARTSEPELLNSGTQPNISPAIDPGHSSGEPNITTSKGSTYKSDKVQLQGNSPTPRDPNVKSTLFPRPDRGVASSTRGLNLRCGEQIRIAMSLRPTEAGIELRWDPIADAVKYTVFVSDFNEKLIDEFETKDKTVHVVATRLDPDTRYEWKLLVELKDGRSIVGRSRSFTAKGIGDGGTPRVSNDGLRPITTLRCMEKRQL